MGAVPDTSITKRVAFRAPYTSVTLNDKALSGAQRSGRLEGLNVIPTSAVSVTVMPGSFLTPLGVAVELLAEFPLSISSALTDPIYLYGHTADEGPSVVTIDVSDADSLPTQAVILAERTSSGRWVRTNPISLAGLLGLSRGGLIGVTTETPTAATDQHSVIVKRLPFETEPLSLLVFSGTGGSGGLRFKRNGSTFPRYGEVGRQSILVENRAFPAGAGKQNFVGDEVIEVLSNRDIVFQSEQLGNGSDVDYLLPSGFTNDPGSNEILVFVDGELRERSRYTELTDRITLDVIEVLGTEVALVMVRPIFFRETFVEGTDFSAGASTLRLVQNAYVSGRRTAWVFKNGRKLVYPNDYSEDDGETVSFSTPLAASDVVEVLGIRSALAGGIARINVDGVFITGGGDGEEVDIDFDPDSIDAQSAPPPIATAGAIGSDDNRFAREGHTHQESFPLSGAVPLGSIPGGAAGSSGTASDAGHRHPTEGLLVTSDQRTIPIVLHPKLTERIPVGAGILSGTTVLPAGNVIMGDHRGLVLYGEAIGGSEFVSGFRRRFSLPLDYVAGTDVEIRLRYALSLDQTIHGGSLSLAAHATADDVVVLDSEAIVFTPTAIAEDSLQLSLEGVELAVPILIPGTSLNPGDWIVFDLARNKPAVGDSYPGDLRLFSLLGAYTG